MDNLATVCTCCHTHQNHQKGGALYKLMKTFKAPDFKGATYMTAVRWQMWDEVKELFPDISFHMTYGSNTKASRRVLRIQKSHINDAYAMGMFHPHHCTPHYLYKKKRRNNRVLAKFYDAKYVDVRDGSKKKGAQLPNGRTTRNRKLDTENLRQYRGVKVSKGRTSVRTQRYPIQSGDTVLYQGKKHKANGCQHYGQYIVLDSKKSVSTKKVKVICHANGYVREALERNAEFKEAVIS